MNIEEIESFLSSAYAYAETSKRTYRDVLNHLFAESADLAEMKATELLELLKQSGWGNARQSMGLTIAQKYLTWKYGHGHPALSAQLKRVQGKPQRALTPETALKLLSSFDPYTAKGARDLAICSLALDTGLRSSELCRLQQSDTDLEHRVLQVLVKGGQWAAAIFGEQTALHIERWKFFRKIANGQGFLFTHIKTGRGLTSEGLYSIVREWGWKIDIQLCVHDLRRSMAVMGTLNGASERSLMEMGRWHSSNMIKRYTRTLRLEQVRKYLVVDRLMGDE